MEHYESRTIELNAEQKTALAMMLRGDSIFLTGSAGTGKSTLLKELAKKKEIKGYSKMKKEELIENLK